MKKIAALLSALLAFSVFFTVPAYAQADASPNSPYLKVEKEQKNAKASPNYWWYDETRPGETYKLTIYIKGEKKYSTYLDSGRWDGIDFTDKETTDELAELFLIFQYMYSTDSVPENYTYSLKKVK